MAFNARAQMLAHQMLIWQDCHTDACGAWGTELECASFKLHVCLGAVSCLITCYSWILACCTCVIIICWSVACLLLSVAA
jgi:hypothetical protein